jgi:hypothetical protein
MRGLLVRTLVAETNSFGAFASVCSSAVSSDCSSARRNGLYSKGVGLIW